MNSKYFASMGARWTKKIGAWPPEHHYRRPRRARRAMTPTVGWIWRRKPGRTAAQRMKEQEIIVRQEVSTYSRVKTNGGIITAEHISTSKRTIENEWSNNTGPKGPGQAWQNP